MLITAFGIGVNKQSLTAFFPIINIGADIYIAVINTGVDTQQSGLEMVLYSVMTLVNIHIALLTRILVLMTVMWVTAPVLIITMWETTLGSIYSEDIIF